VKTWSQKLKGIKHLEELILYGKIILKLILIKYGGKAWIGFNWVVTRISGGLI
jgi:hypothetical protein